MLRSKRKKKELELRAHHAVSCGDHAEHCMVEVVAGGEPGFVVQVVAEWFWVVGEWVVLAAAQNTPTELFQCLHPIRYMTR